MPRKKTSDLNPAEIAGGIVVKPVPITKGEQITIGYDGLLSYSGADQVYLHTGLGTNQKWQSIYDHKMVRTACGWETTFDVKNGSRLNFCFRDSACNWDNNYGNNWSYEIHDGD